MRRNRGIRAHQRALEKIGFSHHRAGRVSLGGARTRRAQRI